MPVICPRTGYEFFLIGEPGCPLESKLDKIQDIRSIHETFKSKEGKFVDWEFPPNNESLGQCDALDGSSLEVIWKRPHELVKLWSADKGDSGCGTTETNGPYFMDPRGFNLGDVNQGWLGNCWYLAAMAILTTNKKLFNVVVPEDNKNGFKEGEYSGAFHYRFWKAGYWVDIVIDDYLPCRMEGGEVKLLFSQAPNNEFWAVLAEKAYSKFFGTYAKTEGGHSSWALEDFTGGMTEYMEFVPGSICYDPKRLLLSAFNSKSLLACGSAFYFGSGDEPPSQEERQGIVPRHAYSITNIKEIRDKFGVTHFLIKLRNPWGCVEFTGKWSDQDDKSWSTVPMDLRKSGAFDKDDGEFWMEFDDFYKFYDGLYVCYWTPPLDKKNLIKQNWVQEVRHGEWIIDTSICQNPANSQEIPTFTTILSDVKCEAVGVTHISEGCPLIVSIMLKKPENTVKIGFRIFKVDDWDSKTFSSEFFGKAIEVTDQNTYSKRAEAWWDSRCTKMLHVEPGKYCIVPFVILDYGQFYLPKTIPFILRILTEHETCLIETAPELGPLPVVDGLEDCQAVDKRLRVKAIQLFLKFAGEDKMLDCCELKSLLENTCESEPLLKDVGKLTCKKLINSVDPDFIGKINFSNACKIFIKLNKYRRLYLKCKTSEKRNGSILPNILKELGLQINCRALRRLKYTYEDPVGKISFDAVVQACITVENCYGIFNRKAYGEGKEIKLTLNEWIQSCLEV